MDNDTICLLKECDSGSKMAVSAIDEVLEKIKDDVEFIDVYLSKEISNYNFHPNKDPFNYNFTLVKRINKSVNAGYWNVWIYDKNIL